MKKVALSIVLFLTLFSRAAVAADPQQLVGRWEGKINVSGGVVRNPKDILDQRRTRILVIESVDHGLVKASYGVEGEKLSPVDVHLEATEKLSFGFRSPAGVDIRLELVDDDTLQGRFRTLHNFMFLKLKKVQ